MRRGDTVALPETRYATNGDVRIAYQVIGHGPIDLVFVPGFISNLEVQWEYPGFSHLLTRLGAFTRLIMFDKRGTGLSDRIDARHLPSLETRMDDMRAVMDAAGSGRAALLGASEGGPMSVLFAATYPTRTRALVLYGSYANFHNWVLSREGLEDFVRGIERAWGTGASAPRFAPDQDDRFKAWWGRYERLSASPTAAVALARMNAEIDVRSALPAVRVPTLVIHRTDDVRIKITGGRYLAEKIPGARFVEMPGRDHPIWTGDVDRVVDEIEEFLTGARPMPDHERVVATIMVARLVAPERLATRLGDRLWSARIEAFCETAKQIIARHNGRQIGEGVTDVIAWFSGPGRAVRCAAAIREAARGLDLQVGAGVHAGEVDIHDDTVTGFPIHVAGLIAARAVADEILVSGVVSDLIGGFALHFVERSTEQFDGLRAPLRLLAVMTEQHLEPRTPSPHEPSLEALSAREREVLTLVAEGLSNLAIAGKLKLSDHTVKRHVANILLKLDLPTRAAAAALLGRKKPLRGL
jgi:pimeloyl-ACP methyl ester carboxylesterase/DNA-binding CsgD family transcriptional regulator